MRDSRRDSRLHQPSDSNQAMTMEIDTSWDQGMRLSFASKGLAQTGSLRLGLRRSSEALRFRLEHAAQRGKDAGRQLHSATCIFRRAITFRRVGVGCGRRPQHA